MEIDCSSIVKVCLWRKESRKELSPRKGHTERMKDILYTHKHKHTLYTLLSH